LAREPTAEPQYPNIMVMGHMFKQHFVQVSFNFQWLGVLKKKKKKLQKKRGGLGGHI
jgi:hypothetical protein